MQNGCGGELLCLSSRFELLHPSRGFPTCVVLKYNDVTNGGSVHDIPVLMMPLGLSMQIILQGM